MEKNTHYVDFSNPNANKISSASTTIIKEEPKQETLEETSKKLILDEWLGDDKTPNLVKWGIEIGFEKGVKWNEEQNKNKYSEEDMKEAYFTAIKSTSEGWNGEYAGGNHPNIEKKFKEGFEIFIEQYKNK